MSKDSKGGLPQDFVNSIEENVGSFDTGYSYEQKPWLGSPISVCSSTLPSELKPAAQVLKKLGCYARKSGQHDQWFFKKKESNISQLGHPILIESFSGPGSLILTGESLKRITSSSQVHVGNKDAKEALEATMTLNPLETPRDNVVDFGETKGECPYSFAATAICHSQEIYPLMDQVVRNKQAIAKPRIGLIDESTNPLVLVSTPAINFSDHKAKYFETTFEGKSDTEQKKTGDKAQFHIEQMFHILFSTAVARGSEYIFMPAAGLGAFIGDPPTYFNTLKKVASNYAGILNIVYHPATRTFDFQKCFNGYTDGNVVCATKDVWHSAIQASKKGKRVTYHNPSDPHVVYGASTIGKNWYTTYGPESPNYLGEEHVCAMSTAPINSATLNPQPFQKPHLLTIETAYKLNKFYRSILSKLNVTPGQEVNFLSLIQDFEELLDNPNVTADFVHWRILPQIRKAIAHNNRIFSLFTYERNTIHQLVLDYFKLFKANGLELARNKATILLKELRSMVAEKGEIKETKGRGLLASSQTPELKTSGEDSIVTKKIVMMGHQESSNFTCRIPKETHTQFIANMKSIQKASSTYSKSSNITTLLTNIHEHLNNIWMSCKFSRDFDEHEMFFEAKEAEPVSIRLFSILHGVSNYLVAGLDTNKWNRLNLGGLERLQLFLSRIDKEKLNSGNIHKIHILLKEFYEKGTQLKPYIEDSLKETTVELDPAIQGILKQDNQKAVEKLLSSLKELFCSKPEIKLDDIEKFLIEQAQIKELPIKSYLALMEYFCTKYKNNDGCKEDTRPLEKLNESITNYDRNKGFSTTETVKQLKLLVNIKKERYAGTPEEKNIRVHRQEIDFILKLRDKRPSFLRSGNFRHDSCTLFSSSETKKVASSQTEILIEELAKSFRNG